MRTPELCGIGPARLATAAESGLSWRLIVSVVRIISDALSMSDPPIRRIQRAGRTTASP